MRNILVFPDGTEHDFMYPKDINLVVGTPLQISMIDDSVHTLIIRHIQKTDKEIYYHLSV